MHPELLVRKRIWLMTLGLTEQEAEEQIISGFLK